MNCNFTNFVFGMTKLEITEFSSITKEFCAIEAMRGQS